MKSTLQQMSKYAVPALLMAMMGGCASVSDLDKVQKQVDEVRVTANSANATAQEAKALANEAFNTAHAASTTSASAKQISSEASGYAAAAVKSSEAAVGVAVQAQKTVNDATFAFPWMRFDPVTGRFVVQWIVWPTGADYTGASQAPASAPAPAAEAAPSGK